MLFDELVGSLTPVGAMEQILVEKIADNLWRQRRLAGAEAASIQLHSRPDEIAPVVSSSLFGSLSLERISKDDLEPESTQVDVKWCRDVVEEFNEISKKSISDLSHLRCRQVFDFALEIGDEKLSSPQAYIPHENGEVFIFSQQHECEVYHGPRERRFISTNKNN